jgi:hypothetical protein
MGATCLIDFIRTRLRRRGQTRRFRSYVDRELVQHILDNPDLDPAPPSHRTIDFVLLLLNDDDLDGVPAILGQICSLARMHRGYPESLTGPLVFVLFGYPAQDAESATHRAAMVAALGKALGDRVKILHGRGPALVGTVAGKEGPYGAVMAGYHRLLGELTAMEFGQVREVVP